MKNFGLMTDNYSTPIQMTYLIRLSGEVHALTNV